MSRKADLISTSFAELPPEILHTVASFLEGNDARILRMTCRRIGAVASCYAFQQLTFYLHRGDFEMLQHFANHEILSSNVRSLIYVTDVLPERRMSLQKFVTKKTESDDLWYKTICPIVRPEARSRLPLKRPSYTDRDFKRVYDKYVDAHAWQTEILAKGGDFAVLRDVVPKFTGLRDIVVSAASWSREFMWARRPFDALFVQAHDELQPVACRHIGSLLLPLAALGPTIRTLRLGEVDWSVARQFRDPSRFAQLAHICRNVTIFDIEIDTGSNDDDEVGLFSAQCKQILRTGDFRRLLEAMPHLVSLSVGFTFIDEENDLYPAGLCDLVSANTHWKQLKDVKFDLIEAPRQELVDFIRRHSSTLRTIELKDLRLINSSWHIFLRQLRELADDMFLDDISLAGHVQGETEDEDVDPELREERFDFGHSGGSTSAQLADDITNFIIWGDGPSPLDPYRN